MDRHQDTPEKMLIKHMRACEPVSEKLLFSLLGQIASALAHLHDFCREGIGYRSLTPASILVPGSEARPSAKELVGLIKEQTSVSTRAGEDLR
ncbi:Tenascin [Giardia duodenalis]|uniref:Tenascin n=1 Tax=Giardia intestinalis TaxID=5741 RepID=V6TNG3_GIAIN|nr:Tenascin [Giardia intestinalis]